MTTGETLLGIYERLYAKFGPQHWWPAEDAFEVIVGAILTQSAAWVNVEKAIANLKRAGALSPAGLTEISAGDLATAVYPAGYYNVKARKLKAFGERLASGFENDPARLFTLEKMALRGELLSIFGVGPETADSIILYAAGKPIFVVDAYTRRLFSRLGHFSGRASYDEVQAFFHEHLPEDAALFNEYHALIVAQCKASCRKRSLCSGCCLARRCLLGTSSSQASASMI